MAERNRLKGVDMERLVYFCGDIAMVDNLAIEECENIQEPLKKLHDYEIAEEQGLLLRLPCKVGDTVWDNDSGRPFSYRITGYSFGIAEDYIDEPVTEKEIVYYYINSSGSITGSFALSEIGKTVFLTKEEAEKKLESMKGK